MYTVKYYQIYDSTGLGIMEIKRYLDIYYNSVDKFKYGWKVCSTLSHKY